MPPARTVPVRLPEHAYEVVIGAGVLDSLGARVAALAPRSSGRCFMAWDGSLPDGLVARAKESLASAGARVAGAPVVADEPSKSLAQVERLLVELAGSGHERFDPVVALGGGVVGDVAGFAAAVYRRGVPLVQCPTTLLAMVDASVGGKTGVNLAVPGGAGVDLRKNLVGAFHQPILVLADIDALGSLPPRQHRSGLAECVKHALLSADFGDPGLLEWTESAVDRLLARDAGTLTELIARNVAVKARVVESDPREVKPGDAGRALLNLGHTFAHAIETLPGLSPSGRAQDAPLHHGEAVALGLVAACHASASMGLADAGLAGRVTRLLAALGLPTRVGGLPANERVLDRMAGDKKVIGGRLRLVVPAAPGRSRVVESPPREAVIAGLDAIRAGA